MSITNTSKPTSSIANSTKVNIGETWDSNTTTWNTEVRTWNDMASKIGNTTKIFGGFLWAESSLPWTLSTPWLSVGNITNIAKPI